MHTPSIFTTFDGHRRVLSGSLPANALAVKSLVAAAAVGPVLVFDDTTGRSVDIDTRGSDEEIVARLTATTLAEKRLKTASSEEGSPPESTEPDAPEIKGRGRPKLGVIPREVTLLPRHWEWLAEQPGGASVALRKLVEAARHKTSEKDRIRKDHERAYHFMLAIAGDLPGFEESTRALFANDQLKFRELLLKWPVDVRSHAMKLAFPAE